jgi:hypothetical protein
MFKILNRTENDKYRTDEYLFKKSHGDISNIDLDFNEILRILDNGLYKKNTIMYDDMTAKIFIYDEENQDMIINQEIVSNIILNLINNSINRLFDSMKKINTMDSEELKLKIKELIK